jgi:hypothetical protein
MLSRFILLNLVLSGAGLRVQQRALDLLNSTAVSETKTATKKETTIYDITPLCEQWAGGHSSIRNCFPLNSLGSHRDWVQVVAFLILHPIRCVDGIGPNDAVKFGSMTVQYQSHATNNGQLQMECMFTSKINPVKFKALLDPFNIIGTSPFSKLGFGGGLGRYLDPFGLFLSQPAKIDFLPQQTALATFTRARYTLG